MSDELVEEFTEWLKLRGGRDTASVVDDAETFIEWWGDTPFATLADGSHSAIETSNFRSSN